MRTLSTRVLFGSGEVKKKVYPANYVDASDDHAHNDDETVPHSTYHAAVEEDDVLTAETVESLAQAGDEDAMYVQQFEQDLEEMMQGIPDLQSALVSYQEARARINDRKRSRGFWPSKSRGKGFSKGFRKGGSKHQARRNFLQESAGPIAKSVGLWDTGRQNAPSAKTSPEKLQTLSMPKKKICLRTCHRCSSKRTLRQGMYHMKTVWSPSHSLTTSIRHASDKKFAIRSTGFGRVS